MYSHAFGKEIRNWLNVLGEVVAEGYFYSVPRR